MAENAVFANNASATLASSITDSANTLTVSTGQGALFPSVSLGLFETFFYGTLVDTSGNIEIVKCTTHNGSSDTFSIQRAQEDTTARSFSAGDLFEIRITADGLNNLRSDWLATDGYGTGIDYISFDTSGSGACIVTSSTGSTRKILSNSGTNSHYAFGTSPFLQFKTALHFLDNTAGESGTLSASISTSGIYTTATVTAGDQLKGTKANSGATSTVGLFENAASIASGNEVAVRFNPYSSAPNYWYARVTQNSTTATDSIFRITQNGVGSPLAMTGTVAMFGLTTPTSNGGAIETSNGLTFPATQSACSNANTLDDYREATFSMTTSGSDFSGTAPSGTAAFVRIGNMVTMVLPSLSGTSISTTFVASGIPTTARPSSGRNVLVRASDNGGSITIGLATIESDGTIGFYPTQAAGNWTSSGTKSINTSNITYII